MPPPPTPLVSKGVVPSLGSVVPLGGGGGGGLCRVVLRVGV